MSSTPLPELPIVFRPTRTRIVLLSVGGALFVSLMVVAALLNLSAAEVTTFAFIGLLFWGVLALLSRPKVMADAEGVTVVNLTTQRRLAWPEVLGVHLRHGDPWVFLDLADGTSLAAMGIQPGIAKERAIRDAEALRALVETYGTGRHPG